MKEKSIRSQMAGVLVIVDLMVIMIIGLSAYAMLQIRDNAIESMRASITSIEEQAGLTGDLDTYINPEISELNNLARKFINIGIGIAIVGGLLLSGYIYLVRKNICSKLNSFEAFANELAQGRLIARVDAGESDRNEFARLSRAFLTMIEWYDRTIGFVKRESSQINRNVCDMKGSITELNEDIENVAATAQELSASMENMSLAVSNIMDTMTDIDKASKEVANNSIEGASTAKEIKERASSTKEKMAQTQGKLTEIHEQIGAELEDALERIQIVSKIGSLSESIMDITSQTTLLSLNASIEAARAGEAGKGFAVVANEIQNLAEQSRKSVSDIQTIITSVSESVDDLSNNSKRLLDFVSQDVRGSFDEFMGMAVEYNNDADRVKQMVDEYSSISEEIAASLENVTMEMSKIDTTTADCAKAAEEIAVMNTNIGQMSNNTRLSIEDTNGVTIELQKIVDEFEITE